MSGAVQNEGPHPVSPALDLPVPHTVTTRAELESIFAEGDLAGWTRLHERYSGTQGIHTFSRVGFAPQLTEPLACKGHQWDWVTGRGQYFFLTRDPEDWRMRRTLTVWLS